MKNRFKIVTIPVVIALFVGTLVACSKSKGNDTINETPTVIEEKMDSSDVVMRVGEDNITREEVMIYLESSKQEIETLYGSEIWSYEINNDGKTYADLFKQQLIEKIKYIKIVCAQAEKLGINLSEDENLDVDGYTADFMAQISEKDKVTYGIDQETVKQIYKDNVLANKIYESVTLNVNSDVSDEEAKQIVLQYIFLSKDMYKEDGSTVKYTDEELEVIHQKAQELAIQAKDVDDFYTFAKENSENSDEVEMTIGKGDMDQRLEDIAFLLREGEVSSVIETESGYFILYCVNSFDEEATAAKKEEIIRKRQEDAFQIAYSAWEKEIKVTVSDDITKSLLVNQE